MADAAADAPPGLSYKAADHALLLHAKRLLEGQLRQLQAEEAQLRAGVVPAGGAPVVVGEPSTPAPAAAPSRVAPLAADAAVTAALAANYDDSSSDDGAALHAFVEAEERARVAPPPPPAADASASAVQAALLRNLGDSSWLQPAGGFLDTAPT